MDACVSPSAVEAIAIPAARADAAAASSLAIGEPPGPSIQGDCLSDQAWESEGEESSSTTLSSLSAISSLSSDAQDTLDTQTARSSSAEPIAPDEVARGTGGSPTSAPPVADPAFVLQGKAASKLTKAQDRSNRACWLTCASWQGCHCALPSQGVAAVARRVEGEGHCGCGEGCGGCVQRKFRPSCREAPSPAAGGREGGDEVGVALTLRRCIAHQVKSTKRSKRKRKHRHRHVRELEEAQIDWVVFANSKGLVTNVIARLRDTFHICQKDKPLLLKTLLHCPGGG